jgi:hypothetical protein
MLASEATPDLAAAQPRAAAGWLRGVVAPFVLTRGLLVLVAFLSHDLPRLKPWAKPLAGSTSSYLFTPSWLLDVWGRWDSAWYVDIATSGYHVGSLGAGQHNVAFFPLYPLAMRAVAALFPVAVPRPVAALAAGVLLANAAALVALALLHRHVRRRFGDAAADRTVWALLAFPTSFYLSCAYSEAFFLLLAVACFDAAWNERWPLAGATGALLALCRANGVVAVVPLAVLALRGARSRPWRATARALAWTLLVPLGLAIWWAWLWRLTGDPGALSHAQAAWGRRFAWPWQTLLDVQGFEVLDPDRIALLLACAGAVVALFRLSVAEGLFSGALLGPALCSGILTSGARFVAVVFPVFTLVGTVSRGKWVRRVACVAALAIQALLFSNWCRGGFID